jgi:hypothetical protein
VEAVTQPGFWSVNCCVYIFSMPTNGNRTPAIQGDMSPGLAKVNCFTLGCVSVRPKPATVIGNCIPGKPGALSRTTSTCGIPQELCAVQVILFATPF